MGIFLTPSPHVAVAKWGEGRVRGDLFLTTLPFYCVFVMYFIASLIVQLDNK